MEQALTLRSRAYNRSSIERANRIDDIANRYLRNIVNTNSYKKSYDAAFDAQRQGNQDKSFDIQEKAMTRQYSRNTYMGLNQG